jgi:5-methyltetrahydrofolate--homocysteine methyltransferase
VYPETPEFTAARATALVSAGAQIVGGCCGTSPDHIRAIRQALASRTAV